MSPRSLSSSDQRGRKSRGERMELSKKERSKTSGRQLGKEEDPGYFPTSGGKTSGRDLVRVGDPDRKSPVRSRDDWKRQDRGGRYQEEQHVPDERRNERWAVWEEGRPIRREERERGRESKSGQDQYRREDRREDQSRGHGRRGSYLDMNNRESLERISLRKDRSRSKEVRERRRSLFEEASWNGRKSPRRVFDRTEENNDQYQRKKANKDLWDGERSHKSNDERSFSREDEKKCAEKSRDRERREREKGDRRRSERERKERTRSPKLNDERRRSSRAASDEKKRASLREEEQKRVEKDNTDRIRRERREDSSATERKGKVSVSSTRKHSEESGSNCEKKRCSRELSSSKELVEKAPYIRVENEEELVKKAGGDEEVLNKSLPGDSIEAEAASIIKGDVTEQAEVAEEMEVTAHTRPQAEVLEPEVAPHTLEVVETEEVASQATLEMSVEDESVQEDDLFAVERTEVLHELEVVAMEKDAKHAHMEKLKSQIRQLEEDLAAGLQEEEELKRQEEDLQQRLTLFKGQEKKQ